MKINTRSRCMTFILASANVLVRAMGFIYQIIVSALGPEGMGIYQLVFPPYSIALA